MYDIMSTIISGTASDIPLTGAVTCKPGKGTGRLIGGNMVVFQHCDARKLTLLLNDRLLNLDEDIAVESPTHKSTQHRATRTISAQAKSLLNRFDRAAMYSATLEISFSE